MMSKCIYALLYFLLMTFCAFAQNIIKTEWLAKDGQPTVQEKAAIQCTYLTKNDSSFQKKIYKRKGLCQEVITFSDKEFSIKNGLYASYTNQGWINEWGFYKNGEKHGWWFHRIGPFYYQRLEYKNDIMVRIVDSSYIHAPNDIKSVSHSRIVDAEYPGGKKEYIKYLQQNLKEAIRNKLGDIQATVAFFIDKNGLPGAVFMWRTNNFVKDSFLCKIIESMPAWKLAINKQTGETIAAFYLQPMNVFTE